MHRLHRCGCGCARTRVLECVLVQECACAYDCKCQTSTFITFTLTCVVSSHSFSRFLDWHLSRDDFSSSSGHLPFLSLFSLSPSVCLQPLYLLLSLIPSDQGYVFTFFLRVCTPIFLILILPFTFVFFCVLVRVQVRVCE